MSAPPPGYPGYPPPGYPGYPPPGYGYPPPGYGPPRPALPALKPGVIPLRPLSLGDIFNGAVGYIRANPKATLGLTALVVLIVQVIVLMVDIAPFAITNQPALNPSGQPAWNHVAALTIPITAEAIAQALAGILLSGMLTVTVGRAVFGSSITIGQAWQRIRDRILPLIGLAALETLGIAVLIGLVVLILAVAGAAIGLAAVAVGVPLVFALAVVLAYLYTMLSFAPPLIVLERLPVFASIGRSFTLVRNSFWRVLGILLLTGLIAYLIAGAVAFPFGLGELLNLDAEAPKLALLSKVLAAAGSVIGQIITAPFTAGVLVLLYTDRRIRAEAFDLVLQTGAAGGPAATASTDNLWLTRPV